MVLLSLFVLATLLGLSLQLYFGNRRLVMLSQVPPAVGPLPSLSVIIAARDEARTIEPALRSVLAQDYPDLEVVAVDDRSADETPLVLGRLSQTFPRLRTIRIDELPPGWLGKTHALWRGAELAKGEALLFTDADVVMAPGVFRRAVGHLVDQRLDHIAVGPDLRMPGPLLEAFGVTFTIFFSLFTRPWKARDPRSACSIGIGAFNLVRGEAYRAAGTHRAIALAVDDDLKLGRLIKRSRYRQDFLPGRGVVSVAWYGSLGEVVRGLTKNMFAGADYRVSLVLGATLLHLLFFVWPFVALAVTKGWVLALSAGASALLLGLYAGAAAVAGRRSWLAPLFPAASVLFLYILWRSTLLALWRGSIVWRGTAYSLTELRRAVAPPRSPG